MSKFISRFFHEDLLYDVLMEGKYRERDVDMEAISDFQVAVSMMYEYRRLIFKDNSDNTYWASEYNVSRICLDERYISWCGESARMIESIKLKPNGDNSFCVDIEDLNNE